MLLLPVITGHLLQGGIGQQINGTFKEMNRPASGSRNGERETLVAATGLPFEIRADATQICIPGIPLGILAHKDHIVVGIAFIDAACADAEINDFRINAPAPQIGYRTIRRQVDPGHQQRFLRLLRWLAVL